MHVNAAFRVLGMIQAGCFQFSSHDARPSIDFSVISSHGGRDLTVTESKHSSYTLEMEGKKHQTLTETGSETV